VTGLGEVTPVGDWQRGTTPHQFQGRHFCGDADAWLNGIPFADRPGLELGADSVPLCCHALPYDVHVDLDACGCANVEES